MLLIIIRSKDFVIVASSLVIDTVSGLLVLWLLQKSKVFRSLHLPTFGWDDHDKL